MARGKKQSLSAEDLLEQALVSEDMQPYEVPENWVWTKLRNTIELISGRDVPGKLCNDEERGIPYILGASNLGEDSFKVERWIESPVVISRKGDILLSVKGTIGKIYLQREPFVNISRQIMALRPLKALNVLYLKYYLLCITEVLKEAGNGLIPGISRETILQKEVPLPPLQEQQRIVDRIESLFAKLDQAKELAQNALDSFETRKAAILQKAFTGELTAKWREEHGVGVDSWVDKELGDVCSSLQYGTSKKSSDKGKVVVIRMGNLQHGEIDWNSLAYSDDEEDISKYLLQPGDVLFNRTNSPELVGKTSIYRGEHHAIFAGYLIRLRYDRQIIGEYLNYVMNSLRAKEYCNSVKSDGVNQSNINAKKIAAFTLPVPSLEEQQEIVRILNRLFEYEKNADILTDVIEKVEHMKKAILARAFHGELGTNDPSEESSLELLSEVVLS